MDRIKAELIDLIDITNDVKTFVFKTEKKIEFRPGQFLYLFANSDGEEIKRAYSITSTPADENIELTIKLARQGLMTTFLEDNAKIGDTFFLSEVFGEKFAYDNQKKIVLIAGGSGIAPMRSIIKHCTENKLDTKIILFQSCRNYENLVFKTDFEEFKKQNPNLEIIQTLTRENPDNWTGRTGRFNTEIIMDYVDNPKEYDYYLCGPVKMLISIISYLKKKGIDNKQIRRELWGA